MSDLTFHDFDQASFVENPEPRCPCVLLLDTSASMLGDPIKLLRMGVERLQRDLLSDSLAAKRVEIAIVTFGEKVNVASGFSSPDAMHLPPLHANGDTPTGSAVTTAIEMLRQRTREYRRNGVAFFRPWIFLITDGAPTDDWHRAATAIREGERSKAFAFFAVAVPPANLNILSQLSVRAPLKLVSLRFGDLFAWLSHSLLSVSRSQPAQEIALSDPCSSGAMRINASDPHDEDETSDVAILSSRCGQTRTPYLLRVERSSSGWLATYAEITPYDRQTGPALQIPAFQATADAACPSCRATDLLVCSCERVSCWKGASRGSVCPWCRAEVVATSPTETLLGGRG